MEQDTPILEVALRTHSSQGHARSSRAAHGTSSSAPPTSQEMDPLSIMLQRLDSQDTQLYEIQGQLTYIISWILAQSGLSPFPLPPPPDVQLFVYFYLLLIWMFISCLFYVSRIIFLICVYIYIYIYIYISTHLSPYLLRAFLCLYFYYFVIL